MGALHPGQMLEGTSYRVVREIGAGGMGVVYEIEHVRLKKHYVAKVIHDQIKHDDGAARRMEREAQVLASISHPNIVQVHDVGSTPEGVSYFVMEKLEGVDLRTTMRQGVRRLRAIEIVADVLDALEYVHRRGVVHRDIKPENVFLSEQPTGTVTKVLDFGIVHIFDSDGRVSQGRITKTGGFVGTLYYAAPEQMQGKPAGPSNDVYAAGLVLFEMLAGKGPFDDDPGVGLSRCFKPAPLLTEVVPQAPAALAQAVAKALEQDPARRPSAGALASELRAVSAAMRGAPGAAEDEEIRAEVHDLLRHMAPAADVPAPRPAAGRLPTPAEAEAALAPTGAVSAAHATAAPPTPMMAGAPARVSSEPRAVFQVTLASPTSEVAGHEAGVRPAAGRPAAPSAVDAPRTMASLGLPSEPDPPAGETPLALSDAQLPGGYALPLAGPRGPQPTGPQPLAGPFSGPDLLGAGARLGPTTSPPLHHVPPGPPPLFGTTIPVQRTSTPNPPARLVDTSPGLYATVDDQPPSTPVPKQTPWTAIAIAGGGAVVVLTLLVGGGLALRSKISAAPPPAAAPLAEPTTVERGAELGTPASSATSTMPVEMPETAASASAESAPAASTSAAAPATGRTVAAPTGLDRVAAPEQPSSRPAPANAPAKKPDAPANAPAKKPEPPTPPKNASPTQGAEKDGYVKSL